MKDRIPGYSLFGKLGEGGMGEVYAARQVASGLDVAVKVLSPRAAESREDLGRFMREAILLSTLRHPNICQLVDSGETESGRFFLATELLRGRTLAQRLQLDGALAPRRASEIALAIARGLAFAHARHIVHCDIKPANVMLPPDAAVKILDFGLARLTHVESMDEGLVAGTVAYASPELLRGERGDPRIDLWSLGAVLQEMLTGRPPFRGADRSQVVTAVLEGHRDTFDGVDTAVRDAMAPLLDGLMARESSDRFASAAEVAERLEELAPEMPEEPSAETRSTLEMAVPDLRARSPWRRLRRWFGGRR